MSRTPRQPRSFRRRLARRLAAVVLLVVALAALASPWWLPVAIVHVASSQGVAIGSWHAVGWGRIEYRDVTYSRPGVRVHVDVARLPRFVIFPRGRATDAGEAPIEVGRVEATFSATQPAANRAPPSVTALLHSVDQGWAQAARWLPAARVREAVLDLDKTRLELRDLVWDRQELQVHVRMPQREIEGSVALGHARAGVLALQAEVPARRAKLAVTCETSETAAKLAGTATWSDTPFALEAEFGPEGVVPAAASVRAETMSLPPELFGLKGYAPITGSVAAAWSQETYTLNLVARAEPLQGSEWPRATAEVRASGSWQRLRFDAIDIQLPAVRAALSHPLEIDLAGRTPTEPAQFSVDADLGGIPVLEARGHISGTALVRPTEEGNATVEFSVAGEGLGWRELDGGTLNVRGTWRQPELNLSEATIAFGEEARGELSLRYDAVRRHVSDARIRAVLPRAILQHLARNLPPCDRAEIEIAGDGDWPNLRHRGSISLAGFEWTRARRVDGKVHWTGEGTSVAVDGQLGLAGGGTLPFAGEAARADDGVYRGRIDRVAWNDEQGEWWRLEQPVNASYDPASGDLSIEPWRIQGTDFQMSGRALVRGPAVGDVSLQVNGLDGRRFGGVLPEAIRSGRIDRLALRARWDHGPAEVDGSLRALYSPVADTSYAVEGEFQTREGGIAFGSIRVADASGVVLQGEGRLPLLIAGTDAGFRIDLMRDAPIALSLDSQPNPVFWKSIADLTGWTLEDPKLTCHLDGSLAAPRGEVDFSAATLIPPSIKLANGGQLPSLTGLEVRFAADDAGLSITQGMVAVDYRWITLTGQAPWQAWKVWRESGEVDWRHARFDLASNPLPIAIASRIFPTMLAPEGEVSIKIAHRPDDGLSGQIWLHGAAVRPVGPLGSIRDIASQLDFSGYAVVLTELRGYLGGQPVRVTGQADLTDSSHPQFDLRVKSSRVPLVRRAGLIVRAEVDLELKRGPTDVPKVTGRVDFGPSLYSADLLELLPSGVDRPEKRPPYFSVEEEPFSHWQLDVAAHGEGFLRLTTPFYKDLLSTDVRLTGTLGEPRAEGWVWGTGGAVSFPFGRIPVEQVLVTLSRENPFEPQLTVSGEGRVFGYDIRMEASGPASEPRLLFNSDPPLTSQQVFMMLTTGAVPDEEHAIGTSGRASRLAMYIGRNLAAGLGIGGGYGGDDRLEIRSGEDFTREGRETVVVQYDLGRRWAIVGEYDRFDEYNGGIKFRLVNR